MGHDSIKSAAACSRKIWYRSRRVAKKNLRRLRTLGGSSAELSIYVCPTCGGYHLGRQNRKRPGEPEVSPADE